MRLLDGSYGSGLLSGMSGSPDMLGALYGNLPPNQLAALRAARFNDQLGAMAQSFGQSAAPSRLPVTIGQVLGNAGGAMQGAGSAFDQNAASLLAGPTNLQLGKEQLTGARIGNLNNLITLNMWRQAMGQPPLTSEDLASGNYEGGLLSGNSGMGGGPLSGNTGGALQANSQQHAVQMAGELPPGTPLEMRTGGVSAKMETAGGANGGSGSSIQAATGSGQMAMGGPLSGNSFMGVRLPADMGPASYLTLSRLNPAAAARVIGNQYPGPTELMRAYTDFASASPELKPLALQKLVTAAGDRFQLMRNGWAFDKMTNSWMHMPELGTGITGTMDANGRLSASVVPGVENATTAVSTAQAAGPATFRPENVYGAFGQPYQTTARNLPSVLASGVASGAPQLSTGLPSGTTGAQATNPLPLAFKGATAPAPTPGQPGTQGTPLTSTPIPVQTPGGTKDLADIQLGDMFPNGQGIPMPPAPPKGAGFGPPSEATVGRQKDDTALLASYGKEQSENQKIYQDLGHLRDVMQRRLNTNKLAPLWTDLTNVAQGLGLNDLIPKGYDPNDSAAFDKASTDLVFAAVKKLAGQVRVAEIEGYKQANPNKTIPPATNYQIINDILATGRWQDTRTRLANEYWTQTNGAPLSAFNDRFNKMAPLDAITEHMKGQFRQAGWQFPGDVGTPSNPTPTISPFNNDARAVTIRDNYRKGMYGPPGTDKAKQAAQSAFDALGKQ